MGTLSNIQVQPMSVSWNDVDVGFTDGDIEITTEEKGVEITAHQEGTNILDMIRTGKSAEIALTLKETSLSQLQTLLGAGGGNTGSTAQVWTILCIADVSGSLNNRLFFLTGKHPTTKVVTSYVFYMNVNSAGIDPSIPGYTSVSVAVATSAASTAVADAVAAAIDALPEFAAPDPGASTVTVTWSQAGDNPTAPDSGNSGFTLTESTDGTSTLYGWGKTQDFSGMLADSAKLVLHPVTLAAATKTQDINFWKAYPMLGSIVQSGENPRTFAVTFKIFPDSSKADDIRLFAVGDGS